jgi:CheY-like chemotaxis protein
MGIPSSAQFAVSLADVASQVGTSSKLAVNASFGEALRLIKQQPAGRGLVLVRHDSSVALVISPRRVQEILKDAERLEQQFSEAPSRAWHEGIGSKPLILAINTPANLAIEAALKRPEAEKYEPLMTVDSAGRAIVIELAQVIQIQLQASKPADKALRAIRNLNNDDGQRRARFLAALSHELRSPLTSILGYCDILSEHHEVAESTKELVSVIKRSGLQLESLLSNLMDLSELERGQRKLFPKGTDVQPLVQSCIMANVSEAESCGLGMEVVYHMPMAADLKLDSSAVSQLVTLLIQGTIRAAGTGTLRVHVRLRWTGGAVGMGTPMLGIVVEAPARVLTKDHDLQHTHGKHETLAGDCDLSLNFAIASRLTELMGGELMIQPGHGAGEVAPGTIGVSVMLPVDRVAIDQLIYGEDIIERLDSMHTAMPGSKRSGSDPTGEQLVGKRILVAEDGVDNQRLIRMVLEKAGAIVEIVANGKLAVEKTLASVSSEPYSFVMLDMQMPEMDGYEAARMLRSSGYVGPIVAFTAHALSSDRAKCLAAGCDDYVSKPIDRRALIKVCERWAALGVSLEHGQHAA